RAVRLGLALSVEALQSRVPRFERPSAAALARAALRREHALGIGGRPLAFGRGARRRERLQPAKTLAVAPRGRDRVQAGASREQVFLRRFERVDALGILGILERERKRGRDAILLAKDRLDVAPELLGADAEPLALDRHDARATAGKHDDSERGETARASPGATRHAGTAGFALRFRHLATPGR